MAKRCGGSGAVAAPPSEGSISPTPMPLDDAAGQVGARVVGDGAGMGDPPQPAGREEERAGGAHRAVPDAGAEQPTGEGGQPASRGPGAIMKPARRIDSCQTPVRNSTPPRTSAPKPPKKASELSVGEGDGAVPDDGGLNDGVGVAVRAHAPARRPRRRPGEGAHDARAQPAPVRALHDGGHEAGHRTP